MENICKMDCHACTLQEGDENKALCATLFMPAMLNKITMLLQRIESETATKEVELKKVILDYKPTKVKKDESIEE